MEMKLSLIGRLVTDIRNYDDNIATLLEKCDGDLTGLNEFDLLLMRQIEHSRQVDIDELTILLEDIGEEWRLDHE